MWLESNVASSLGFFILPVFELGGVDGFVEIYGTWYLSLVSLQIESNDSREPTFDYFGY